MLLGMFVILLLRIQWIIGYDGKTVTFWYRDNDEMVHVVSLGVFEFIEALIQAYPGSSV
jgi:hypothetical protein